MRSKFYTCYLASPKWQHTRASAIVAAGGACADCGTQRRLLDVHHLTYRRLGHEHLSDLTAVCRPCHDARHRDGDHQWEQLPLWGEEPA
jgi:5-methylcytosine-specific restriction endonuclease McrA